MRRVNPQSTVSFQCSFFAEYKANKAGKAAEPIPAAKDSTLTIPVVHSHSGVHACDPRFVGGVKETIAAQVASVGQGAQKALYTMLKPSALRDFNKRMSASCFSLGAKLAEVTANNESRGGHTLRARHFFDSRAPDLPML